MIPTFAEELNQRCHCVALQPPPGVDAGLVAREPVFLSSADADAIARFVARFEKEVRQPAYIAQAMQRAPDIARHDFGPRGVFTSFDFHVAGGTTDSDGPKLIEVNTNGGGALVNASVLPDDDVTDRWLDMFENEWALAGRRGPLSTIAIVDDDPASQPMHREFELFVALFARRGWKAIIADPSEVPFADVDVIYNRHTDFYFAEQPALRDAYVGGHSIITPHPRAHALYADKRNLMALQQLPEVLASQLVDAASADALWRDRKKYYFKPAAGHGSRGVYRGAKLTRGKWQDIVAAGHYVAQREVAPGKREIVVDGDRRNLKYDIRAYAYQGEVQLLAARLYRGQTTNARTAGGGFAPVVVTP